MPHTHQTIKTSRYGFTEDWNIRDNIANNHKKVVLSRVLCHANEIKIHWLKQAQETSE